MIEVLREGEPTTDGRFICYGAVELPTEPVPLFDYDKDAGADKYVAMGTLFNFVRGIDNRIYCESDPEDERQVTVTVTIDEREFIDGEEIGILRARIVGGVLSAELTYPWSKDE